ncbi:SDR family NAD(P)-dependent oxidoreductase [Arcobacter sp. FWKO B]|uniref:SDR family NAD(P)-dependent oxidoreductase n=1 Tax=Arcobacter sp. FWKO B TaxID=2593672 RepID=UPI0018A41C96|nr:SDR family NAD(P)-dependent oxidoreductase [Arcobacter sp. FWKO B]QOG12500.1 SDR family NAD(P)-dependent oxidoreductase [Arcobacter sp. FWKO B]
MDKKVVLTGSSSGIGKAIAEVLEKNGYYIISFTSRLEDVASIEKEAKDILASNDIDVLINSAGFGMFEPHEELNPKNISQLIAVNLTAPIILSNLFLRSLKKTKGHIINITSIEATKHSKFSATYTASKAGLRDFSLSLFEEVRKSGVRVTSINPDITKTPFYDNLKFEPSHSDDTYLLPQTIADSVLEVLNIKGVITDISIRPQRLEIKKK